MSESFPGEHGESQDVKLSEAEIKMVAKLLSDPTYFPIEFRTWLKNYIEGSGITIQASQIRGGAGGSVSLPAGIIIPYAGGSIATNVLPCDGNAVSRTFYDGLYEAIGTTWGAGDGSTTFNVPDLRDRALWGAGSVVGLGATDGAPIGSRGGPYHHHYFDVYTDNGGYHGHGAWADGDGSHQHSLGGSAPKAANSADSAMPVPTASGSGAFYTDTQGYHSHGIGIAGDGEHNHHVNGNTYGGYDDKPSHAGIKYVITTGKGA